MDEHSIGGDLDNREGKDELANEAAALPPAESFREEEPVLDLEVLFEKQLAEQIARSDEARKSLEGKTSDEVLREQWAHDRLIITGPAAIAATMDAGRELVPWVGLLMSTRAVTPPKSGIIDKPDDLRVVMQQDEFEKLETWINQQGLADRPIHLTREMELTAPFSALVRNAPKVQLWHDPNLPPPGPINNTNRHELAAELAEEPTMPERLEGNGTLAGALAAMEWGEMLGLPYDDTPLRTAENLTRRSTLMLATRSGSDTLDPMFIEQLQQNPQLAEKLRAGHRRLVALSDEIVVAGGVASYITKNYGEVYLLEWRSINHGARLDDPRLVDSPSSLDEQMDFLVRWRAVSERFEAAEAPHRMDDEVDLPCPDELPKLIDSQRMQSAVDERAKHVCELDRMTGSYRLEILSNEPQLRAKAQEYLRVMGLGSLEDVQIAGESIEDTLVRIGIHSNDPFIKRLTPTPGHQEELVISARPEDILQASYKKPWTSCVDLERGNHTEGLYEDIANGAVVAYLVREGQYVARALVRAGITLDGAEKPAAAIERVYGDERYEDVIRGALEHIAGQAGIESGRPMRTAAYSEQTFFDSDSGAEAADEGRDYHFYYTDSKQ